MCVARVTRSDEGNAHVTLRSINSTVIPMGRPDELRSLERERRGGSRIDALSAVSQSSIAASGLAQLVRPSPHLKLLV